MSPHQNALSDLWEVSVDVRWHATCDNQDVLDIWAILAWNTPSNKLGFALRQDVLSMLCVNFVWPLSTKNVPMSCVSGCKYENVHLQWAVMYTRGEGSTCGWWPAEAPDVQRCLGHVLCCKCVVRSWLPDTHWGIWAADDGSLFPACKINCRLLRIYDMKLLTKRNPWLVRKKEELVKKKRT